jgi:hypothetical protein
VHYIVSFGVVLPPQQQGQRSGAGDRGPEEESAVGRRLE